MKNDAGTQKMMQTTALMLHYTRGGARGGGGMHCLAEYQNRDDNKNKNKTNNNNSNNSNNSNDKNNNNNNNNTILCAGVLRAHLLDVPGRVQGVEQRRRGPPELLRGEHLRVGRLERLEEPRDLDFIMNNIIDIN